jgi:hypothetical protein
METIPLWLVAASLSLNVIFLRRLLSKIDDVHDCLAGTLDRPGLVDRMAHVEAFLRERFQYERRTMP